jgi:hypothetical protein
LAIARSAICVRPSPAPGNVSGTVLSRRLTSHHFLPFCPLMTESRSTSHRCHLTARVGPGQAGRRETMAGNRRDPGPDRVSGVPLPGRAHAPGPTRIPGRFPSRRCGHRLAGIPAGTDESGRHAAGRHVLPIAETPGQRPSRARSTRRHPARPRRNAWPETQCARACGTCGGPGYVRDGPHGGTAIDKPRSAGRARPPSLAPPHT